MKRKHKHKVILKLTKQQLEMVTTSFNLNITNIIRVIMDNIYVTNK